MSAIVETSIYDEMEDKLIVKTTYNNTELLEANKVERNATPEFGKYKGTLCKVGSIHEGDIVRLKGLGYNLLSPDRDEVRRALVYIQSEEPYLLTVSGRPFARKRVTWA